MFLMKCPDNFPFSQYRGKTVGLDSDWISPWASNGRASKTWVVVDPVPGKIEGEAIPKIIWESLEEEKKRQSQIEKLTQKEARKALQETTKQESSKTKGSAPKERRTPKESKGTVEPSFFNPFKIAIA